MSDYRWQPSPNVLAATSNSNALVPEAPAVSEALGAIEEPGQYIVTVRPRPASTTDVVYGNWFVNAVFDVGQGAARTRYAVPVRAVGSAFAVASSDLRLYANRNAPTPILQADGAILPGVRWRWSATYDLIAVAQGSTGPIDIPELAYAVRVLPSGGGPLNLRFQDGSGGTVVAWFLNSGSDYNNRMGGYRPVPATGLTFDLNNTNAFAVECTVEWLCGVEEG